MDDALSSLKTKMVVREQAGTTPIERAKALPPPWWGPVVPLELIPYYFELWKIQAKTGVFDKPIPQERGDRWRNHYPDPQILVEKIGGQSQQVQE